MIAIASYHAVGRLEEALGDTEVEQLGEHIPVKREVAIVEGILEVIRDELSDGHMFRHPEGSCLISRLGGGLPRHVRGPVRVVIAVAVELRVGIAPAAEINVADKRPEKLKQKTKMQVKFSRPEMLAEPSTSRKSQSTSPSSSLPAISPVIS